MATTDVIKAPVWEDADAICMARVVGADGVNITVASLTSIFWAVYNRITKALVAESDELTVANVVFDSLQTDARWSRDNTGYNFRHRVPDTVLTNPNIIYAVEYKFTATGGEVFWVVFDLSTREIITA